MTEEQKLHLLRELGRDYQSVLEEHNGKVRKIGNRIPVGGDHMDSFFRAEAGRGFYDAIRQDASVEDALAAGRREAAAAVRKWNSRREYQVHRWEGTADSWLEGRVRLALSKMPA